MRKGRRARTVTPSESSRPSPKGQTGGRQVRNTFLLIVHPDLWHLHFGRRRRYGGRCGWRRRRAQPRWGTHCSSAASRAFAFSGNIRLTWMIGLFRMEKLEAPVRKQPLERRILQIDVVAPQVPGNLPQRLRLPGAEADDQVFKIVRKHAAVQGAQFGRQRRRHRSVALLGRMRREVRHVPPQNRQAWSSQRARCAMQTRLAGSPFAEKA